MQSMKPRAGALKRSIKSMISQTKKKKEDTITNVRNKRGDITLVFIPDPMEIKRMIKEYCQQAYAQNLITYMK